MATASSTAGGRPKYPLRNDCNGLRIALPTCAFGSIVPSASSSVISSGTKLIPYDVFINHCGQDVKHTLASSIYNSLDVTGLRVFLDKDELKLGDFFPEALEAAIRNASIHIAIFSEHYAQSPWCLAELAVMVETGNTIIPIFYHVQPSDLRWAVGGKGAYGNAFSEHAKKDRYAPDVLQRWKRALQQVSCCHGEIVENMEDEQRVIKSVVSRVLEKMEKPRLEIPKYPVGLNEAVQRFDAIAFQSSRPSHENVQIVGIWGMGGSGKTTLAKELFNRKFSAIGRSSFLSDIRDAAGKGLLVEKQKKLLADLDVKGVYFDDVEEGKGILKSRLRSLSVLIILDDVDHTDQLDALLPEKERLGNGSLIVVTTRELDVLKAWDISAIYEMKGLNATHAKELFCWHAFKQPSSQPGFEDLVEEFLKGCNGLPLSLKVLGAQLYNKSDKQFWQSLLHKLSRILPDDIKMRLRVSYDALDEEEKEMFLDTACFFIGWRKSVAIEVWEGSGWSGVHGWERLFNKCLVEEVEDAEITINDHFSDLGMEVGNIGMHRKIRMHDHLRDLGREIANSHSPYRLWFPQQSIQIHPQQETIQIRGMVNAIGDNCYPEQGKIIIRTNQGERRLQPSSLGLKIFVGNGDFINEEYSQISRELVWFQCYDFMPNNIPLWFSLKKLRILRLRQPHCLEDLWESDAHVPLQLRELVIESLFSQEFSLRGFPKSIAHLQNLKKILIFNCVRLSSLPEEFCLLQSLERLDIRESEDLSSLPNHFGRLSNLLHLDFKGCKKLKMLPDSFKKLTLLEHLNLEGCEELAIKVELHIFENMTKLRYMNLNNCRELKELGFLNGTSLTEVYLEGTSLMELPANIFQLIKLTNLQIGSDFLTTLPTSVGNLSPLTSLKIKGCNELKSLPDSLEHLSFLTDLYIGHSGVKGLPNSFVHLVNLTIENTPINEVSFGSGCLLKMLTLEGTKLSKIAICGDYCPFLETLHLCWNKCLREFETLPQTLKTIYVSHCEVLKDMRGIRDLKNLQNLDIDLCENLETLPSLAELTSLKRFKLISSNKLVKIEGLDKLTSLETLEIRKCPELSGLPSLAELTSLSRFELQVCPKSDKIEGLQSLRSLELLVVAPGNRSAVPFISNIEKWPREVMTCTSTACDLGLLKNFFEELPNVFVLDYSEIVDLGNGYFKLRRPENSNNVNAILMCFIIDCVYPDLLFFVNAGRGACFNTELSKGKWAWIGVFTQDSSWLQSNGEYISALRREDGSKLKRVEVKIEAAWLVIGEEGSIVKAFHPILERVTGAELSSVM